MSFINEVPFKKDPCYGEGDRRFCLQLQNDHDSAYIAEIYVGTPPQKLRALFDTGSSNTWVLNTKVFNGKIDAFDDTLSSTCVKTERHATIHFGSGDLDGYFYEDTFQIGTGPHAMKIKNQRFGNIEHQHHIFGDTFEIILGLAYPQLAQVGQTPVFDNIINQKLLKHNMFSFYLTGDNQINDSELTFGYYD